MNQEIKAAWVAALRSGKYTQGFHVLRRIKPEARNSKEARDPMDVKFSTFCAQGVLCHVLQQRGSPLSFRYLSGSDYWIFGGEACSGISLVREVMEEIGMPDNWGMGLTLSGVTANIGHMNDCGVKFETIADLIEAQL